MTKPRRAPATSSGYDAEVFRGIEDKFLEPTTEILTKAQRACAAYAKGDDFESRCADARELMLTLGLPLFRLRGKDAEADA